MNLSKTNIALIPSTILGTFIMSMITAVIVNSLPRHSMNESVIYPKTIVMALAILLTLSPALSSIFMYVKHKYKGYVSYLTLLLLNFLFMNSMCIPLVEKAFRRGL